MRPLAVAVVLLLLLSQVKAIEITNYRASLEIEDELARGEVTLSLLNDQNTTIAEFRYPLFGRLANLEVLSGDKRLSFSVEVSGERTYVITPLPEPLEHGESYEITYRYILRDVVERHENIYILSVTHSLFANVKNFEFTVALPPGYGVVENGVSPESTPTSDGRRVILKWELHEPIPPEFKDFRVIVIYENLFEARNYLYPALLALAALVILFLSYKYLKARGVSIRLLLDRKKRLEEKIEILKEDEQKIMKLIIDNDGIDQRDIVRITGFSKTKVSRILSELEKRGAIRKEQIGRRNRIYLAKKP
ncbi:MAG: winged helix-turn-helix transcriptional regulator [Euryarchaeota archaeon]|nr:winged helix-turn-helix transcriptional regulator [Euryarchaeota archaeon]